MEETTNTFLWWLEIEFLGIAIWQYIVSLVIILGTFFVRKVLEVIVIRRLLHLFSKTSTRYDEKIIKAIGSPLSAFVFIAGIYFATLVLIGGREFPWDVAKFLSRAYAVATGVIIIWTIYRLIDVLMEYLHEVAGKKKRTIDRQFVPLIRTSLRLFVIIVGTLTILGSLDVDVTGFIAGLGIGGLAIALAAQDTLSNLFGSIAILTDRPFKIGDWIQIGDKVNGMVEGIGFRTTRVRTWPKTLLSIPNKVLANEIVDNWSRMPKRRVYHMIGVTYQTTPEQMETLLEGMRQILREDEGVDQDFFLIKFRDFGPSSLDIMVYYFTKSTAWLEHLSVRENINLKFIKCIQDAGSSIAYPTRTVYLESKQTDSL